MREKSEASRRLRHDAKEDEKGIDYRAKRKAKRPDEEHGIAKRRYIIEEQQSLFARLDSRRKALEDLANNTSTLQKYSEVVIQIHEASKNRNTVMGAMESVDTYQFFDTGKDVPKEVEKPVVYVATSMRAPTMTMGGAGSGPRLPAPKSGGRQREYNPADPYVSFSAKQKKKTTKKNQKKPTKKKNNSRCRHTPLRLLMLLCCYIVFDD
jgi:hypothetical protein